MVFNRQDALKLLAEIEGHLGSVRGRMPDLRRAISDLPFPEEPEPFSCPRCGLGFSSEEKRTDHLANVHGERGEP